MNSKGHLTISLVKSGVRIVGCGIGIALSSLTVVASALILAELLGVAEELVDKR
jgi:hypothetical protein